MAGHTSIERCPSNLPKRWQAIWRQARDEMKEAGTFTAAMRPLLDEYVYAMQAAEDARKGFKWLDALEVYAHENAAELELPDWRALAQITGSLPSMWDKHVKRAADLAGLLGLTPKAQRDLKRKTTGKDGGDGDSKPDPFAALDGSGDELAPRRRRRAS